MSIYDDFMAKQSPQQPVGNSIYEKFMAGQQQDQLPVENQEQTFYNIVSDVGRGLMQPAATALEAISYLDKPRGAIAGAVKAAQNDEDLWEGAKQGWQDNTSWKETFNQDWVKENPNLATAAGFAADVIADPTWLVTPAKLIKGVASGSKAIGLTDNIVNPAVNAVKRSELGAKTIAGIEDALGVNRVAGLQDTYNVGRSTDRVLADDFTDQLGKLKKDFGEGADEATKYIEALPREIQTGNTSIDVAKATKEGTIYKAIKDGEISREEAFNALRNAGEEIPDQLLQTHQRQAKALQQEIPDYVYRDQVLSSIPDQNLRKAIQTIGDSVIEQNKKFSDKIYDIGRIGDAEYVEFMGGSHLRRSFEKYATPDEFLAAVKKNGTEEEWKRAYTDYAKKRADNIGGTHRVDVQDFAKRQTLSEETLKKMGVITDAEYKVKDTFARASKTLREEEFLTNVNQAFGKTADEAAKLSKNLPESRRYVPIPDTKGYGSLAGQWVPADVARQVMGTLGTKPDNISKSWQKLVSWFKVSKLAAPAPIMRNLYSGLPMANTFGRVPIQAIPQDMARVLSAYKNGGKNNPLLREFRSSGALEGEWVQNELKTILTGKATGIKGLAEKGMEAFGAPDKFWRAVVFSYHRRNGKSIEEAGKIAKKALLDYSAAPDWINTLSKSGAVPFAKFPFMAAKESTAALYNNPASVTKWTKLQNQQNTEDRDKIIPDYLKSKTLLPVGQRERTVDGKPQKVQQNIDLSYILPFASDISFGNPVIDALQLARTGRNGLNMQIIKPGMSDKEKLQAWATFGLNTVAPSAVSPYNVEKLYNAYKGNVDSKGRQYEMGDAIAQTIFGIKNVPINVDELYRQGMSRINSEQRDVKAIMGSIQRDKSLNQEQKREKLQDHYGQLRELAKQAQEMQRAYQREKKRGAI